MACLKSGGALDVTTNPALFKKLVLLGQELIELHLLRRALPVITGYPKAGSNRIDKIEFRPDPHDPEKGRVQINAEQYFERMPRPVWEYKIGGYQVANKWLKVRKGRLLTFDELQHYGRVVAVLDETIRLQGEIDTTIGKWPLC
jgi:Type ISP C-terminal specificity domain